METISRIKIQPTIYFVFMYENRTIKLVETVLRRRGEKIKDKEGRSESN
jgi:hypothetical protein